MNATEKILKKKAAERVAAQAAKDTYFTQLYHQAAMEFTAVMLRQDIAENASEMGIRAAKVFVNQLREDDRP